MTYWVSGINQNVINQDISRALKTKELPTSQNVQEHKKDPHACPYTPPSPSDTVFNLTIN